MKHGASGYQRGGCRCEICTEGNREHKQRWREQRRKDGLTVRGESIYPKHRNVRQWPLQELLDAVPDARARLRVDTVQWNRALEHGMSDRLADTWAVKCGVHPGTCFAGWFERGLSPLDRLALYGSARGYPGWRPAYEYEQAS